MALPEGHLKLENRINFGATYSFLVKQWYFVLVIVKNSRLKATTRRIYSNSERSEVFLKQNTLCVPGDLSVEIQIGKNNWDLETCRKN